MGKSDDTMTPESAEGISEDTGSRQVSEDQVADVLAASAELQPLEGTALQAADTDRVGDMGLAQYIRPTVVEGRTAEEVAYMAIIQQILDSETPQDVLTPIEAVNLTDELDRPCLVKRWEAIESEYEQGSPFYAAIQVDWLDTGEKGVVTTGNQAVLAQLISLGFRSAYPIEGKFVQYGRPNKYGTMPVRIARPDWESKKRPQGS